MSQIEMLDLIKQYNSTDRKLIKANLKRLMIQYNIKPSEIVDLGYKPNNVYSWTNQNEKSTNIPMFDDALNLAVHFNFNVKEFTKNI